MLTDSNVMESCITNPAQVHHDYKFTQVVVILVVDFDALHWVGIFIQGGDSNSIRAYHSKAFESFRRIK